MNKTMELLLRAILDGTNATNERLLAVETRLARMEESIAGLHVELSIHRHNDHGEPPA